MPHWCSSFYNVSHSLDVNMHSWMSVHVFITFMLSFVLGISWSLFSQCFCHDIQSTVYSFGLGLYMIPTCISVHILECTEVIAIWLLNFFEYAHQWFVVSDYIDFTNKNSSGAIFLIHVVCVLLLSQCCCTWFLQWIGFC